MYVGFTRLDPAIGSAAAIGLLEKRSPVLNGAKEVADMDEVKSVVIPRPTKRGIVDLKLNIGRDPTGKCK